MYILGSCSSYARWEGTHHNPTISSTLHLRCLKATLRTIRRSSVFSGRIRVRFQRFVDSVSCLEHASLFKILRKMCPSSL